MHEGRVCWFTSLLIISAVTAPAAAASTPASAGASVDKLVVLPVTVASGIDAKKGKLLDEVVLTELARHKPGSVSLIGSSDIVTVLGLEQQRQLLDCDDASCMAEIGNALGASHILTLNLGEMGSRFVITAKIVNASTAEVLFRKGTYTGASEDALLDGVSETAQAVAVALEWAEQEPSDEPFDVLLWTGAGLAGVGALTAVGLGIGAVAYDVAVVGDGSMAIDEREAAADTAMLMGAVSAGGAVVLSAGAALLLVSLL